MRFLALFALLLLTPAAAVAQVARWSLTRVWEIGAVSGEQALSSINALAATEDETLLAVAQPLELSVKLYDANAGVLQRVIGRRGAGPCEFQSVRSVWLLGDTLTVVDSRQQRVSHFSVGTGEHLATALVSVFADSLRMRFLASAPRADGGFWARPVLTVTRIANERIDSIPIGVIDAAGQALTIVSHYHVAIGRVQVGGRIMHFNQPFASPGIVATAPDGSSMLVVETAPRGQVRVRRLNARGTSEYSVLLKTAPRPVTSAERDSVYDEFARRFPAGQGRRVARREVSEHIDVPDHHPGVTEALLGIDGRAWLRLSNTQRWLVLDTRGVLQGDVIVPSGVTLMLASRRSVYGVRKDELDVPYLIRFDLNVPDGRG